MQIRTKKASSHRFCEKPQKNPCYIVALDESRSFNKIVWTSISYMVAVYIIQIASLL